MADDNIVRPVFGQKKPGAKPTAKPLAPGEPASEASDDYSRLEPPTGDALVRAETDFLYMVSNSGFVGEMRDKLEKASDTIFNLGGFIADQESIRLRRQGLKAYSLEEICREVDKTHELQWRRQPSYLGALTLEHHSRVQVALSLMNKKDPK